MEDTKLTEKAKKIISKVWGEMFPGDNPTIKIKYEPGKAGGGKYWADLPRGGIVEFSYELLADETDRNLEINARAQIKSSISNT